MEFKGTKGEWRNDIGFDDLEGYYSCIVLTNAQTGINPAIAYGLSIKETEANAKLIAAAPNLLKELQKIKLDIDLGTISISKQSPIYRGIVEAIKKATE